MDAPIVTIEKALKDARALVSILHLTTPYTHLPTTLKDAETRLASFYLPPETVRRWLTSLRRELGMRRKVYPKFVAQGRMTEQDAADEIACIQAIHDYLAHLHPPPPAPGTTGQLL